MASPSGSRFATGSSKTTGTSLSVAGSSTLAVGDYVFVTFAMDQAAGTVSVGISGTAVIGAWTVDKDTSNGSGTAGTRFVATYAKCTTAGTITGTTVTHPSVAARAGETSKVTGADGSTPILFSGTSNTAAPALGPVSAGLDLLMVGSCAQQAASGGAVNSGATGIPAGWSASGNDGTTFGTTGGGATSNISTAIRWAQRAPSIAESPSCTVVASADQWYDAVWQAPAGASPLTLTDRATSVRAGGSVDTLTLGLTKADAPSAARAGTPTETLSLPASSPLTLTDRPTGALAGIPADTLTLGLTRADTVTASRAGGPRDLLTLGLTRTDTPGASRAGGPREALTLGLTRTDTPGPARAGNPAGTLTLGVTLTDTAGAARAGRSAETLSLTGGAPLTLADRAGASRAAATRDTLSFGLTILDRPLAVRGGDGADLLTLGMTILDRPTVVRLSGPLDTVSVLVGAGPVTVVHLRGATSRDGALAGTGTHAGRSSGTSAHDGRTRGTATHESPLTGKDA